LTHPDFKSSAIDGLVGQGYAVLPGYFSRSFTDALLMDLQNRSLSPRRNRAQRK